MKREFFLAAVIFYALFLTKSGFADLGQAEISFLKGDYDIAIKNCDTMINSGVSSEIPRAFYLKARIFLKQGRISEARQIFSKILADFPAGEFSDEAQLGFADTFFAEENFDRAIGEYRKIGEKYPQSPFCAIALYKLSKSCLKAGRMEEARFYFQKLQQDYPSSFESKLIDELDNSEFAYSVQVGCFSKYENAERLVAKLKKKGFDAYISEKEGAPVFYRVRVGKFRTQEQAQACKASLIRAGYKTKICP